MAVRTAWLQSKPDPFAHASMKVAMLGRPADPRPEATHEEVEPAPHTGRSRPYFEASTSGASFHGVP